MKVLLEMDSRIDEMRQTKSPEDKKRMPSSAGVMSAPAKPLCFSDYVMRQEEGLRYECKVGKERKQVLKRTRLKETIGDVKRGRLRENRERLSEGS